MDKETQKTKARKPWPLLKIVVTLVCACLIFAAGIAVGRGDLEINGLSSNSNLPGQLNYSSLNQVYDLLKNNYDGNLNSTQLLDGAKAGLVSAAGDPYTEYFNPTEAKAFNNELAGQFSGIGAELGTDSNNDIEVISPLAGSPAAKAGLMPKDIISAVNGQTTSGQNVDSVVDLIRGKAGTKVTLSIVRGGSPLSITITRENITVPSVTWSENGNIGYIDISQFSNDTVGLATQAAQQFKAKGVKGVVLDLRGDPGGYLSGAVGVSSLWLEPGKTIVSERRGSTVIDTEVATGNDLLQGLPTVVLINSGSASASEITAGALHDNGAATLVGQTSFGKGSVQEVENLSDGSEVKITIAHWYTPDGVNINKTGIKPDVSVSVSAAQTAAGQDPQLTEADSIVQSKISQ